MRSSSYTVWLMFLAMAGIIINPFFSGLASAAPVTLPSGYVLELTKEQLEIIKSQPGVAFSETAPEALSGQVAVAMPGELGGGFIYGTPEALSGAINASGAAIGVAPEMVIASGLSTATKMAIAIGVAVAVAAGVAAAVSGDGGVTPVSHHP